MDYSQLADKRAYVTAVIVEIFEKDIRRRVKVKNVSVFNTDNRINYGPVLENVVYSYARARGYSVSVGRIGKLECDFILRSPTMDYSYVQVAMIIMADRFTEEREYRPFAQIKDNYPKYLLTRNDPIQHRDGIIHANIPEFMQKGRYF